MFARRVHLFLFVKVRENWAEEREHYGEMGLEYPGGMISSPGTICKHGMEWSDDAIVLSVAAARRNERHRRGADARRMAAISGLVRGGASRRSRPAFSRAIRCHLHGGAALRTSGQFRRRTLRVRRAGDMHREPRSRCWG